MQASLRFVAGLAVAILSISLLCGTSDQAMSQPTPESTTVLPNVTVDAPKHRARPRPVVIPHRTALRRTPQTTARTASATPDAVPAKDSVTAKLAKLASATGSCVGGCQSSFRSGDKPWVGCSGSSWPALSSTCRNVGGYKTYAECTEAGLLTGWRNNEIPWYCASLGLK
jgi:hypothetical protein